MTFGRLVRVPPRQRWPKTWETCWRNKNFADHVASNIRAYWANHRDKVTVTVEDKVVKTDLIAGLPPDMYRRLIEPAEEIGAGLSDKSIVA